MSFHTFLLIGSFVAMLICGAINLDARRKKQSDNILAVSFVMLVIVLVILVLTGCTPRY